MGTIYALPPELIALIFSELDVQSLLRCKQVCRLFSNIDSVPLQYKVELFLAGMEDGPPGHHTLKERLDMLRAHQDAWNSLSWSSEETIPIAQGRCWELNGGILAQSDSQSSIEFRQLPSALRGIKSREWKIDNFDFDVADFAIDPSQDLLVVIEATDCFKIHIRSLTTGEPHPLASSPLIRHEWLHGEQSFCTKIRNSSFLVGIMAMTESGDKLLAFYNWRTGHFEMEKRASSLECFAFVTDSLVMIGSVFTDPQHAQLDIHDFNTDPYYCLCSFLFPIELEHEWLGIELDISGDLSSQWAPHPSLGVPFYTSHKAKLFAITYRSAHPPFTLLLPLSTVLSHVYAIQTDRTCIVAISRDIPWELWGSNGTRLAQLTHLSYTWIRRAFGQQFVQGARTALDPVHFEVVRLYDLNQWSLKHALSSVNAGDKHNTQILLKATALDGDNFSPPITTSFPCRIRFVELKLDFQAMMMHEDGFIAVSHSGTHFHLFTF